MTDWIDDAIDGMANSPQQAAEDFVRDQLAGCTKLVMVWQNADGSITWRASHMRLVDAVGLAEVAKAAFMAEFLDQDGEEVEA